MTLDENYLGEMKVIRLLSDGTPDPAFGEAGTVSLTINLESYGYGLLIRDNGKIVITGLTSIQPYVFAMLVVQLNEDGSLDTTFGTDGATTITMGPWDEFANAISLQDDGKILIAGDVVDELGNHIPTVVRLTEQGSLDASFGLNGIAQYAVSTVDNELWGIGVQSDGKIIAGGHYGNDFSDFDVLLLRFNTDGTLDESFGTGGAIIDPISNFGMDECFDLLIEENDQIVIAGYAELSNLGYQAFTKRYDANGMADTDFGTDGVVSFGGSSNEVAYALGHNADGGFVFAGARVYFQRWQLLCGV